MQKEVETRLIGPKRVKRANSWCVTVKGQTQKQEWFKTEEEALDFIKNFTKEK